MDTDELYIATSRSTVGAVERDGKAVSAEQVTRDTAGGTGAAITIAALAGALMISAGQVGLGVGVIALGIAASVAIGCSERNETTDRGPER